MLILFEHPLSPFAQKNKIALREKGLAFEARLPAAIGTGMTPADFLAANPRGEVPALVHDGFAVFDSTVILEYIEDAFPAPPLRPDTPAGRARARMIEEVMDTAFEPVNWGLGELRWFRRAEGERAAAIEARAAGQIAGLYGWLERQLGDNEWFVDGRFGWADLSVIPYVNGASGLGHAPDPGRPLGRWQARANARPSVATTAQEAIASTAGMTDVSAAVKAGLFKREYRDHRLDWMMRSGGLDIVLEGLKSGTIRFSNEFR